MGCRLQTSIQNAERLSCNMESSSPPLPIMLGNVPGEPFTARARPFPDRSSLGRQILQFMFNRDFTPYYNKCVIIIGIQCHINVAIILRQKKNYGNLQISSFHLQRLVVVWGTLSLFANVGYHLLDLVFILQILNGYSKF